MLALPHPNKQFIVETDAYDGGIGAVLIQDGHPLAYISRALASKHQGLLIYENELLVVVYAVRKWEHYLGPNKFIIKTGHKSLKYLLE